MHYDIIVAVAIEFLFISSGFNILYYLSSFSFRMLASESAT